ncbi:MAG TPA: hypothetical protein VK081_07375 [Planctomycetota bacterium]|nr:hypothetical protein [Planctomycetota bacterium]
MRTLLLPCTALLLCAGCFQAETEVVLRADGSGCQHLRLVLPDRALGLLRGAVQAVESTARRSDPRDLLDEKKVRAELTDCGVDLRAYRANAEGARHAVEIDVEFAGLAALRANPLTGGERATWQIEGGPAAGLVRLVWYPQGEEAWRAARRKARELAGESDAAVQQFVQSRLRQIDGLDVRLALTLPGNVVAHTANLKLEGKRKVVASIAAEDVRTANDLLLRIAPRYEVVFECPSFPVPDAAAAAAGSAR